MKIGAHVVLFNARMRERRKEMGITQIDLAEISGVNVGFVSRVEILQPLSPTHTTRGHLNAIANTLDCDFDYLFPKDYIDAMAKNMLPGYRNVIFVKDISLNELPPSTEQFLLPPVEDAAIENIMKEDVVELLDCIDNPRERKVLEMRYGLDGNERMRLEDVARKFGVSRERIRQIEYTALSKLRHPSQSEKVRDYDRGSGAPLPRWYR